MAITCPTCRSADCHLFFTQPGIPVSIGVQWPTEDQAINCMRGDLSLAICERCGFIWNAAFDASRLEYSMRYDNSLDFSPVFQEYARGLAKRLIETHGLRGKDIVELGCGKGHFLALLCEEGENRGIGFDPSYEGERVASSAADRITYVQDFYSEKYTHHRGDLICSRHVFEHIPDPVSFLQTVKRAIGGRLSTVVYFEVPNVRFILDQLSVWDVIYEHCNYFSSESLRYVFEANGLEVLRVGDAYRGQFLGIECRLRKDEVADLAFPDVADLTESARTFSSEVTARASAWEKRLRELSAMQQGRIVVWGAGAKAVSFLNMVKGAENISFVVDINPHKAGLHMPGTGQKIVPPELLREIKPDVVILMNPIYREEVSDALKSLGVTAEIVGA